MGRPRKMRGRPKTTRLKCKLCGSILHHIGRRELDSNRLVEAGFIIIKGKVGWGGKKIYDLFFCDKCERTHVIEAL